MREVTVVIVTVAAASSFGAFAVAVLLWSFPSLFLLKALLTEVCLSLGLNDGDLPVVRDFAGFDGTCALKSCKQNKQAGLLFPSSVWLGMEVCSLTDNFCWQAAKNSKLGVKTTFSKVSNMNLENCWEYTKPCIMSLRNLLSLLPGQVLETFNDEKAKQLANGTLNQTGIHLLAATCMTYVLSRVPFELYSWARRNGSTLAPFSLGPLLGMDGPAILGFRRLELLAATAQEHEGKIQPGEVKR